MGLNHQLCITEIPINETIDLLSFKRQSNIIEGSEYFSSAICESTAVLSLWGIKQVFLIPTFKKLTLNIDYI